MSDGLTRRELVIAGGTAAALASSSPGMAQVHRRRCPEAGYSDHHGQDPRCEPRYESGTSQGYNPQYIAVVMVDFEANWTVNVHHASFPLYPPTTTGNTPNYRLDIAVDVISWVLINSSRKLGHLKLSDFSKRDHVPYKRVLGSHANKQHVPSFDDFKFYNQNEIFIFLRNKDILLNEERLLRFTKYSDRLSGIMGENYAFFNARYIEGSSLGSLGSHGKLIRVENHATKSNAERITDPVNYSMNIHFKMKVTREPGAGQRYAAMILDPDTGNGTGNEP